jgi:hypothetical protein
MICASAACDEPSRTTAANKRLRQWGDIPTPPETTDAVKF